MEDILKRKNNIFDHILYEFSMYLITYKSIKFGLPGINDNLLDDAVLIDNILYESHLIHIRNLMLFFDLVKYSHRNSDVTSRTILGDTTDDRENVAEYKSSIERDYNAINKTIAHITLDRMDDETNLMCKTLVDRMYNELFPLISDFIKKIDSVDIPNDKWAKMLDDVDIQKRKNDIKVLIGESNIEDFLLNSFPSVSLNSFIKDERAML